MKLKKFSVTFFFNGEEYNVQSYKKFNLKDLIKFFNYKENLVVIEYNGKISQPQKWYMTYVKNMDKIEILTIVGGG